MAYGIDSMAHRLSIEAGGTTIGVNAAGLMHLYPTGNLSRIQLLLSRVCDLGISLNTRPLPYLFPIRNRIIAGICIYPGG